MPPDDPAKPAPSQWAQLKELIAHVFIGVSVFLLLAIPAIALDFFNQAVELIVIVRPAIESSQQASSAGQLDKSNNDPKPGQPRIIKVSEPSKWVLRGAEYFILAGDSMFVVVYLSNGLWKFLRSFKWK